MAKERVDVATLIDTGEEHERVHDRREDLKTEKVNFHRVNLSAPPEFFGVVYAELEKRKVLGNPTSLSQFVREAVLAYVNTNGLDMERIEEIAERIRRKVKDVEKKRVIP